MFPCHQYRSGVSHFGRDDKGTLSESDICDLFFSNIWRLWKAGSLLVEALAPLSIARWRRRSESFNHSFQTYRMPQSRFSALAAIRRVVGWRWTPFSKPSGTWTKFTVGPKLVTPNMSAPLPCLAFTILSGARDDAIASMLERHVNLEERTVFQDAREVRTKNRKTFTSTFFPVGTDIEGSLSSGFHF
jgi:hypothetical protein